MKTCRKAGQVKTRPPAIRGGRGDLPDAGKGRPVFPHGGNDRIYTPRLLALDIVRHFGPSGRILEPAAGDGAFLDAIPGADWCEIDKKRDFFDLRGHFDWIITNPPYSLFTDFLKKSIETADNVVFLCPAAAWFQRARERAIAKAGFGLVELCYTPLPPKPWPQFGLSLAAAWVRRGWQGGIAKTRLPSRLWAPDGSGKMVIPPEEER
jgi:hypothetical protein